MTMPPPFVDTGAATAFLLDHLGRDVTDVSFVGEGYWSRCFGYTHGGTDFVIRFGNHIDDFHRDKLASRYADPNLPIPTVLEIGEVFGAYYAISTRAYGTPLEKLDSVAWNATLPSVIGVLDGLRTSDVSHTTGYGIWDHTGNAPFPTWREYLLSAAVDMPTRRTHGWKAKLAESSVGLTSHERGVAMIAELTGSMPPPPRSLIHNDLLNRNALAENDRVTGVFDWGCSIYGDALYESAAMIFWEPWYPAIARTDMRNRVKEHLQSIHANDALAHFDDRVRCCAIHIGIEHLGYNAFVENEDDLLATHDRLADFL